jgi:hypothetical protein
LNEAYNNLYVEPLKEKQKFKEFYVERPATSSSPMAELKDRIEISSRKEKYLFLGFKALERAPSLTA